MANKPTYRAYQVEDGGQDDDTSKGRWTEIGAAWPTARMDPGLRSSSALGATCVRSFTETGGMPLGT